MISFLLFIILISIIGFSVLIVGFLRKRLARSSQQSAKDEDVSKLNIKKKKKKTDVNLFRSLVVTIVIEIVFSLLLKWIFYEDVEVTSSIIIAIAVFSSFPLFFILFELVPFSIKIFNRKFQRVTKTKNDSNSLIMESEKKNSNIVN